MVRRILLLTAILFAVTAVPAHAGGPTSVLLSAPPHVTAFGYDDPRYGDLQSLVQTEAVPGETTEPHGTGKFVRATWLIHDMSVWRIDVIYPDAPGGPWIATEDNPAEGGPAKVVWHRSTDPVKLRRLLDATKLLTGQFQGGPTLDGTYSAPEPSPEPTAQPAQLETATATTFFTGWRWAIPGVLLGAAVTALVLRLYPKRRWELID